jgi:hypothetical protein
VAFCLARFAEAGFCFAEIAGYEQMYAVMYTPELKENLQHHNTRRTTVLHLELPEYTGYAMGATGVINLTLVAWNGLSRKRGKKLIEEELARREQELAGKYILRLRGHTWDRVNGAGEIAPGVFGS